MQKQPNCQIFNIFKVLQVVQRVGVSYTCVCSVIALFNGNHVLYYKQAPSRNVLQGMLVTILNLLHNTCTWDFAGCINNYIDLKFAHLQILFISFTFNSRSQQGRSLKCTNLRWCMFIVLLTFCGQQLYMFNTIKDQSLTCSTTTCRLCFLAHLLVIIVNDVCICRIW